MDEFKEKKGDRELEIKMKMKIKKKCGGHLDARGGLGDYVNALLIESSGGAGPVKLRQPGSS